MNATYNITNNRFFFDPARRLTPEEYEKSKALKFQWYPGRKIFSGIWSPEKEDFLLSFVEQIEEDDTPDDVEARAERFQQYAEKNEEEAINAAQRSATANTERRQRLAAGRAQTAQEKAEHWQRRTAAAIAHAQRKDNPGVITRRIEGIEKDQRYFNKEKDNAQKFINAWNNTAYELDQKRAEGIAGYGGHFQGNAPAKEGDKYKHSLYDGLRDGRITPEEARKIAVETLEKRIAYCDRWLQHLQRRLDYENAYLAAVGGDMRQAQLLPGMKIVCRWGECVVLKVNKKTVDVQASPNGRTFKTRIERSTIKEVLTA